MCSAALLLHCRQAVFQWLGTRTALYGDGVHHTGPFILYCWPAVFFTLELSTEYGTYLTALTVGPERSSGYIPLIRTRSEGFSLPGTRACLCINNILPVVKWTLTSAYWKQRFVNAPPYFYLKIFLVSISRVFLDRCSLVDLGVLWNMFLSAQQVHTHNEEPVQHPQPCCQQREGRRKPWLR